MYMTIFATCSHNSSYQIVRLLGGRRSDLSHTLQSLKTAVVRGLLDKRGVGATRLEEEVGVAVTSKGARDPGVGV